MNTFLEVYRNKNLSDFVKIFHIVANSELNNFEVGLTAKNRFDEQKTHDRIKKNELIDTICSFRDKVILNSFMQGYLYITILDDNFKATMEFDVYV